MRRYVQTLLQAHKALCRALTLRRSAVGSDLETPMAVFSGSLSDLEEAVSFELNALDFVRTALFAQSEAPGNTMRIDLGTTKNGNGQYPRQISHVSIITMGQGDVQSALSRLRPLIFSAAFKIQDMIAEWILHANGSKAWQFKAKQQAYDALQKAGTLSEPDVFQTWPDLSRAFWALYKTLTPLRSTIVHASGFTVQPGGTLEIYHYTACVRLTHDQQASYCRAICLLAKQLLLNVPFAGIAGVLVENDFSTMLPIHKQGGFTFRPLRIEALHVAVPPEQVKSTRPFEMSIDFLELREQTGRAFPTPGGVLACQMIIQVDEGSRILTWDFPAKLVPTTAQVLKEGDPLFDRYLTIRPK